MKIASVAFDGYLPLPDCTIRLAPATGEPHKVFAVTGPRGSGKTSFLEAIIAAKEMVAPYGAQPPAARQSAAKITIEWCLSPTERGRLLVQSSTLRTEAIFAPQAPKTKPDPVVVALLGDYSEDPTIGKVEYFHAARRLPWGGAVSLTEPGSTASAANRLTRSDDKYEGLVEYVVEAGLGLARDPAGQPREQGRVSRAFGALCQTKTIDGIYRLRTGVAPVFADSSDHSFTVSQLSDSELDAFLFAATFVRCGIVGSVVLIDTPEKHVGDDDAWTFLQALTTLAPDNQFIVATRARSILSALAPEQIVRLGAP